ncbi:MAG: hypothetical protein EXQ86_07200 [Rhodospirillales bacterium]|nr:hypothetical protein [Rhodospirillales bacterium]
MNDRPSDPHARRSLLLTTPNPDARLDYVITLGGRVAWAGREASLCLRYVPDRSVIDAEAFGRYLDAFAGAPATPLESLAATVLADINDQLVPRWAEVAATAPGGTRLKEHSVLIADRQPKWDNPALLARLARH